MVTQKTQYASFLVLLAIASILTALVYAPFAQVLIMAGVTAVMMQSFYKHTLSLVKGREWLAVLLSMIVLLTLIVVPVALIGAKITKDTTHLYTIVTEKQDLLFARLQHSIDQFTNDLLPGIEIDVLTAVKQVLGYITSKLGGIFSSIASLAGSVVLWFIATFYLIKDGHRFVDRFIELSPLSDNFDHIIADRMEMAIHSVVRGQLLVATIQGFLTGLGFAVLGIPSAAIWGLVAAFCALVPGVGTSLVIIPGIAYLAFTNHPIQALILVIWGGLAVGVIDNVLGPSVIGKGANIHPLLVLFAVLGGFAIYGPLGFILGPLSVSFFIALLDIYRIIVLRDTSRVGQQG